MTCKLDWLLIYDISSPRRLRRVARTAEDFGFRVQRSVFECHLDNASARRLWCRLLQEIDEATDLVTLLPLCSSCRKGVIERGHTLQHDAPRQAVFGI